MKNKKWYLAIALLAATSGCAGLEDCRYEHVQRLRARSEYHKCGAPQCERYPKDYKIGYLDGFYAVSTGGPCCPPAVAPQRYWRVKQVLGNCDNRRHSYYSGWQDGAARAACFPDTHYLRLFETCECPVPRCEGCITPGVGCNQCGCGATMGVVHPGLINGEWANQPPIVVGNDPVYSGDITPLPSPIVADDDAMIDTTDPDGDDAELLPPAAAKDVGDEADEADAASDADEPNEASSDADDEAMPSPRRNLELDDENDIDDETSPLSPSDITEEQGGQTLGKNEPSVAPETAVVVEQSLAAVDPATVNDASDRAIENQTVLEVETVEVAPEGTRIENASHQPLDRNTIQAMFGIDDSFDFRGAGMVSYQSEDPIAENLAVKHPSFPAQSLRPIELGHDAAENAETDAAKSIADEANETASAAGLETLLSPVQTEASGTVEEAAFDPTSLPTTEPSL